ncbi:hypothetical protein CBF97_09510, partial [Streptococcus pyogenes]
HCLKKNGLAFLVKGTICSRREKVSLGGLNGGVPAGYIAYSIAEKTGGGLSSWFFVAGAIASKKMVLLFW